MDVYIELVYVINLAILMICFECMAILLHIQLSYKKVLVYSILMNYSIVMLYFDTIYYILLIGWFALFLILFKKQVFLYYPTFIILYYSLLYFIQSLVSQAFIYQGILITPIHYSDILLCVMAILFIIIQTMFIVYCRRKVVHGSLLYDVSIQYKNKQYFVQGFLDSGNEVYYQGFPLLLLRKDIMEYSPLDTITIDNIANVTIDVIQVEQCIVNRQQLHNIYVGMIETMQYDCLLHKEIMGGVL